MPVTVIGRLGLETRKGGETRKESGGEAGLRRRRNKIKPRGPFQVTFGLR